MQNNRNMFVGSYVIDDNLLYFDVITVGVGFYYGEEWVKVMIVNIVETFRF